MTKVGSTTRGLPNNTSTTAKTELAEVPRDSSIHNDKKSNNNNNNSNGNDNKKAKITGLDKPNEMLKANTRTASHINNIDENGTTATKKAKQLPGNILQQSSTTTTLNNTLLNRCENPTQNTTTANQSIYSPRRKRGSNF